MKDWEILHPIEWASNSIFCNMRVAEYLDQQETIYSKPKYIPEKVELLRVQ